MKSVGWILGIALLTLFKYDSLAQSIQISKEDIKRAYITVDGIYKLPNKNGYSSICIPEKVFDGYRYITITANREYSTRVHILKGSPSNNNQRVKYSDYYRESILVCKGIKLDIVIPRDAKSIYILNSRDGNNNTPDLISLHRADTINNYIVNIKTKSAQDLSPMSHQFLHWNIGHFSNGQYPYSTITETDYIRKLNAFRNFFNTYCPDCHYLLNEYDETFATVDGEHFNTNSLLFSERKIEKVFPRSTSSGFNKLAAFWKEGVLGYKYGIFESLKGVKNSRGTLEYGAGYCISKYSIGGDSLYVMSLHAPNRIKKAEYDKLYREIIEICSDYNNCILVGDFNRITARDFIVLTDAGFSILNDDSVTHPRTGYTLDWVLYRCTSVTLSDFRVFTEAIDINGDLLSDHLPLSFRVTYGSQNKNNNTN